MNSRDRELLAAEYEGEGRVTMAACIRSGQDPEDTETALRAISQARIEEREAFQRWLVRMAIEAKDNTDLAVALSAASIVISKGDHLIPVSDDRDE